MPATAATTTAAMAKRTPADRGRGCASATFDSRVTPTDVDAGRRAAPSLAWVRAMASACVARTASTTGVTVLERPGVWLRRPVRRRASTW